MLSFLPFFFTSGQSCTGFCISSGVQTLFLAVFVEPGTSEEENYLFFADSNACRQLIFLCKKYVQLNKLFWIFFFFSSFYCSVYYFVHVLVMACTMYMYSDCCQFRDFINYLSKQHTRFTYVNLALLVFLIEVNTWQLLRLLPGFLQFCFQFSGFWGDVPSLLVDTKRKYFMDYR